MMRVRRSLPWILMASPACGGNVVVDHRGEPAASTSSSSGGAGAESLEEMCERICAGTVEIAGIQCPSLEDCIDECGQDIDVSEAMGCEPEYRALWECVLRKVGEELKCPVSCEDENSAWYDCKNPPKGDGL